MQIKDKIFVAIDVDDIDAAKKLMDQLVGLVSHVKIGLQLATGTSWGECIAAAQERGFKVFCDGKFKDIPNTLEHAAFATAEHGADFFTVMSDNSAEALAAVRTGVDRSANHPKIIGVTVLTSISPSQCLQIYGGDVPTKAKLFGDQALEAGLDGIVCSPEEIQLFRQDAKFRNTLIITPGVRPAWAGANDQSRFMTPTQALKLGADMLVIGRPITAPPTQIGTPAAAIKRIIDELEENL